MSRSGNGKNPCPLGEAFKVDDPLASQLKPGDYGTDEQREMIDASYSTIKNDFIRRFESFIARG